MLLQETVDDPPRLAAAEGPCQPGLTLGGEREAVRLRGSGLGRQHQCAADLRGRRARDQYGRHRRAVGDPTRRDQGQVDPPRDQPQRRQQSQVLGARGIGEVAAVTARLKALDDERVGAGVSGHGRLVGVGHRHPDVEAGAVHSADQLGRRTAECE